MHDVGADMKDRLRASELLGKSCCDFSEKLNLEHSGDIQLSWLPAESLTVEPVDGVGDSGQINLEWLPPESAS